MENLSEIDRQYHKFMMNLNHWIPDGLIQVSLDTLAEKGLLNFYETENEPGFTRYFHAVESEEKITLINEQFIVWIVPKKTEESSFTYVLIALNHTEGAHLEIAFSVMGVYNTSRLVLKLLEKYLVEIQEVEDSLKSLQK